MTTGARSVFIRSIVTTGLLLLCLSTEQAAAQSYPTRPVTIIVPSSPGGITDIAARFLGERLTKLWGKQIIVENRSGGGGSIGVAAAARAAADGYTLLMTTNGELTLVPEINKSITYDRKRDFLPIAMVTSNSASFLVANTSTP